MLKALFLASLLLISQPIFAEISDIEKAEHQITSVEVYQVPNPSFDKAVVTLPGVKNPIDEIAAQIDGIIAIGKKIWTIIDAGRPVITTSGLVPSISVFPELDTPGKTPGMHQMANWSAPKVVSYRVSYKNYFGGEVVGFTYTVFFQHGGSYKGRGKYITSLKVQASEITASWGFNFDATSELVSIANVGSDEEPVASAILQISYKVKGLLNENRTSQSFYVDGRGAVQAF